MNSQKHHRNDKLQKSSVLFLQLGLVLALFLTYTALEFESIKTGFDFTAEDTSEPPLEFEADIICFIADPIETEPVERKVFSKSLENIEVVPDHVPTPEEFLEPTDKDPEPTVSSIIDDLPDLTGEENNEPEPFVLIENPPIFPGCEGLEKKASKQCFTNEISKFVNRKFNTSVADNLSGKQKIWVQFVIDKTGTVIDIEARSPHKRLEKEAIRVVEKLPQMIPGKQRTKAVKVKYTLPIIFQTY